LTLKINCAAETDLHKSFILVSPSKYEMGSGSVKILYTWIHFKILKGILICKNPLDLDPLQNMKWDLDLYKSYLLGSPSKYEMGS